MAADRVKIFGPPGTGKTSSMIDMIKRDVAIGREAGARAADIIRETAFVAYTRNAAQNARAKLRDTFQIEDDDCPWFRTLHSSCFRLLEIKHENLVTAEHLASFAAKYRYQFSTETLGYFSAASIAANPFLSFAGGREGDFFMAMWDLARHKGRTDDLLGVMMGHQPPRELMGRGSPAEGIHSVGRMILFRDAYEGWKAEQNLSDFTDLLVLVANRGLAPGVTRLYVDEAQDLSALMWKVVSVWEKNVDLMIVSGDDDQTIFEHSGANPRLFLGWQAPVDRTFVLDESHRLAPAQLDYAKRLIDRNVVRKVKDYRPTDRYGDGFIRVVPSLDEVEWVAGMTYCVLIRNQVFAADVAGRFMFEGEPFENRTTIGGNPLRRSRELLCVVAAVSLSDGKSITGDQVVDLLDGIRVRSRDGERAFLAVGSKSKLRERVAASDRLSFGIEHLDEFGATPELTATIKGDPYRVVDGVREETLDYWRRVVGRFGLAGLVEKPARVVSTYHKIKGEEFDYAICLPHMTKKTWDSMTLGGMEPERRVFYTGITRAKRGVYLIRPDGQSVKYAFEWPPP